MRVRYSFSCRRTGIIDPHNKHRTAFPKIATEVVSGSDIIIEVLDARFPAETRNPELESLIEGKNKKIIYVINKTDLADMKTLREKVREMGIFPHVFISCKQKRGSGELRRRIKIEAKKIKSDKKIVGIIGYPNTGKSSIINYLVGKKSTRVSAESGFTKGIQKVRIADDIVIMDSPGVIPEKEYSLSPEAILKHSKINVRTYDKVKEPAMIVHKLMKEYPEVIERFYCIDAKGDSELLIETLGKKKHLLSRGGEVDEDRTARVILRDWQEGKIKISLNISKI